MSKPNKSKIQTSGAQEPLNNAFAGALSNLGPLPEGPAEPPSVSRETAMAKKGRVLLRRETAHRGGKAVVIAHDFDPAIRDAELEEIARQLKKKLGVGGMVQGREVEIQGEKVAEVRTLLEQLGFRVGGVR